MQYALPFFVAAVDRLYWAIFKQRDMRVDPKGVGPGGPLRAWAEAIICGLAGAAGSYVVGRVLGQTDALSSLAGAFIGGRIVGGIIDSVSS